jgi:hypothetical protein
VVVIVVGTPFVIKPYIAPTAFAFFGLCGREAESLTAEWPRPLLLLIPQFCNSNKRTP